MALWQVACVWFVLQFVFRQCNETDNTQTHLHTHLWLNGGHGEKNTVHYTLRDYQQDTSVQKCKMFQFGNTIR